MRNISVLLALYLINALCARLLVAAPTRNDVFLLQPPRRFLSIRVLVGREVLETASAEKRGFRCGGQGLQLG